MKNTEKQLIRQITIAERLPVILLATVGLLFIIASFFAWIWFGVIVSLKMAAMGLLAVIIGMKLENIIILYVDKQLQKEMHTPGIVGKWEARIIDLHDKIDYTNQEKANKEVIEEIMDNICKN